MVSANVQLGPLSAHLNGCQIVSLACLPVKSAHCMVWSFAVFLDTICAHHWRSQSLERPEVMCQEATSLAHEESAAEALQVATNRFCPVKYFAIKHSFTSPTAKNVPLVIRKLLTIKHISVRETEAWRGHTWRLFAEGAPHSTLS